MEKKYFVSCQSLLLIKIIKKFRTKTFKSYINNDVSNICGCILEGLEYISQFNNVCNSKTMTNLCCNKKQHIEKRRALKFYM